MFKVKNKENRCCSGVFIVNFEHISPCSSVSIVKIEQVNAGWVFKVKIKNLTTLILDLIHGFHPEYKFAQSTRALLTTPFLISNLKTSY